MLEFVDSGLYFVEDENNYINLLLQVGSGSSSLLFRYTICKKRTHSHFELLFFCSGSSLVGLQRVVMIGLFVSFHVGLQGAHELTHVTMVGDVVVVPRFKGLLAQS